MWKPLQTVKKWFGTEVPVLLANSNSGDFEEKMKRELFGHRIIKVEGSKGDGEGYLYLDNGRRLHLVGNEGCGGCGNGWFYLTKDLDFNDNAIMNVELEEDRTGYDDYVYRLWIISSNTKINSVEFGGYDNGYYGTGFEVFVEINDDEVIE